ncbi:MAG: glutamine synthetase family protein [Thermomicrobiales bacterium]
MATASAQGMLTVAQLTDFVARGEVDTVVCAICDMQGRLVGKRVTGGYFIEHCLDHGTHFCTYLLGTDMELNTPDGFPLMNWSSGYGDYLARPDWSTMRLVPWLEKTALVLADAVDETTGDEVPVSPRTILTSQIARAASLGFQPKMAMELEFYLVRGSFADARAQGYAGLQPFGWYNEDYQLFQATKAEPLYRKIRNLMTEAGVPIEFSKGEAAPGQHEVNIQYAGALESADRTVIFKHGAKEIAYQDGYAITFMAKPDHTWTGSSGHIHLSLWDSVDATTSRFHDPSSVGGVARTMRHFLGGVMAGARELSLLVANNVNSYKRYATASWAPVNIVWGRDNRTCGFRVVGSGSSLRIENRFPGGDANPYLASAAMLAAGLHGVEQEIEPPAECVGNGYEARGVTRVPRTLHEAIAAFAASALARACFGDVVVDHYLNAARIEQEAFDQVVTDWERMRYFERG